MTTYLTYADQPPRTETDEAVIANLVRKGWVITDPPVVEEVPPTYTAEQWLEHNGLGGNRQPTLIYLKLQLQAAGKVSQKLSALESYLNAILASYAQDQSAKSGWSNPPYSFEEAVGQALADVAGAV